MSRGVASITVWLAAVGVSTALAGDFEINSVEIEALDASNGGPA